MSHQDRIHRTVLPIPDRPRTGLVTYDAKDPETKFPPITQLRPPNGAPNVLIVLLDDVGFGASSAFGGPCNTPTAERLAVAGLKYNRFHTTALCSPTRPARLTRRKHHRQGRELDWATEGAHSRQALLRLLRTGRGPRPAPRPQGMDRQVQGQVRPGLGQATRGDICTTEETGRDSTGLPAYPEAQRNPRMG